MTSEVTVEGGEDEAPILVVSFTGVEQRMGMPPEEFKNTLASLHVSMVFVTDKTKTWYNNIGTVDYIKISLDRITKRQGTGTKVIFLGLSMGGFGAILFSSICKCDKVIAFSPQIDISPKLTTNWDMRYNKHVNHLDEFIHPTVGECFSDGVHYDIVCGKNVIDKIHLEKIPKRKNINKIIIKEAGHNVPAYLKENNQLFSFLEKLIIEDE